MYNKLGKIKKGLERDDNNQIYEKYNPSKMCEL